MGYRIIIKINISSSSICYFFFIISITRRKITFKRHRKRWLFNICFFIEGGSIRIKESSSNMNYMRKLFIMINFIRECRGQEILRERTRGDWVCSMLLLVFPANQKLCPNYSKAQMDTRQNLRDDIYLETFPNTLSKPQNFEKI